MNDFAQDPEKVLLPLSYHQALKSALDKAVALLNQKTQTPSQPMELVKRELVIKETMEMTKPEPMIEPPRKSLPPQTGYKKTVMFGPSKTTHPKVGRETRWTSKVSQKVRQAQKKAFKGFRTRGFEGIA